MPNEKILKKYADVFIRFALWGGKGINPGEAVCIFVPECAKPILIPLQESILEAGGFPIINFHPDGIMKSFYEKASDDQLKYFPKNYSLGRVEDATHFVNIIATNDKHELEGIDSKKMMQRNLATKFYVDAGHQKEARKEMSWTLGLFGTEAMAKEVGMSLEEYWEQIINACFLNEEDPITKWKEIFEKIGDYKRKLDELQIEGVHIKGEDVDLQIKLGENRKWLGGSGRNIPSFELFISPDFRGTNGWVKFNQPLYRFGNLIEGIELEFKDGTVISSKASKNEQLLKEMIAVEGADKIGEFSMTDRRFSRITKFMGETLYDENVGGEFGNSHIALGRAYKDSYPGDQTKLSAEDWKNIGYNDSVIHTDIITTTNRTVTAILKDGSEKVIYKDGEFVI